jgi:hypothetical protein
MIAPVHLLLMPWRGPLTDADGGPTVSQLRIGVNGDLA